MSSMGMRRTGWSRRRYPDLGSTAYREPMRERLELIGGSKISSFRNGNLLSWCVEVDIPIRRYQLGLVGVLMYFIVFSNTSTTSSIYEIEL